MYEPGTSQVRGVRAVDWACALDCAGWACYIGHTACTVGYREQWSRRALESDGLRVLKNESSCSYASYASYDLVRVMGQSPVGRASATSGCQRVGWVGRHGPGKYFAGRTRLGPPRGPRAHCLRRADKDFSDEEIERIRHLLPRSGRSTSNHHTYMYFHIEGASGNVGNAPSTSSTLIKYDSFSSSAISAYVFKEWCKPDMSTDALSCVLV